MAGGGGDSTAPRGTLQKGEAALQASDRTTLRREQKNRTESEMGFNSLLLQCVSACV